MSDLPSPRSMWEQRHSADTYIYGTEPNDFLRDNVARLPPWTALCLAEGEGRNAVFLAESGFDVHSVDLTEAGVARSLRLAECRGVQVLAVAGDLAVFEIGTEFIHAEELDRDVIEGAGHTGIGAVVQVIAHKPV